jgi:hypothetical protein
LNFPLPNRQDFKDLLLETLKDLRSLGIEGPTKQMACDHAAQLVGVQDTLSRAEYVTNDNGPRRLNWWDWQLCWARKDLVDEGAVLNERHNCWALPEDTPGSPEGNHEPLKKEKP